ncbi:hypothetical protein IWX49DRAFT_101152 [Phyllosticta citricarpa]|uniref:Uncharacterized protein n=2 Tax=Phyllosticta TaxID=121621 RepID=A0ABR1MRR3_9PEZI
MVPPAGGQSRTCSSMRGATRAEYGRENSKPLLLACVPFCLARLNYGLLLLPANCLPAGLISRLLCPARPVPILSAHLSLQKYPTVCPNWLPFSTLRSWLPCERCRFRCLCRKPCEQDRGSDEKKRERVPKVKGNNNVGVENCGTGEEGVKRKKRKKRERGDQGKKRRNSPAQRRLRPRTDRWKDDDGRKTQRKKTRGKGQMATDMAPQEAASCRLCGCASQKARPHRGEYPEPPLAPCIHPVRRP